MSEVLRNLTERIFKMTEGSKNLTEHPPVNVRTPTKIGNKMSEPMGKLSEWFFTPQKLLIFHSFYTKINEKPKVQTLIC